MYVIVVAFQWKWLSVINVMSCYDGQFKFKFYGTVRHGDPSPHKHREYVRIFYVENNIE